MPIESGRVVVLGAGQAGGWVAATLRARGFAGPLTLVGSEPHAPYERPPLSKELLRGEWPFQRLAIKQPGYWAEAGIDLRTGRTSIAIERAARAVVLDDGTAVPYDHLVLATGARPRRLTVPGSDDPRVHYLRDVDDALALRAALADARRVAVVGGGLIGLEIAACAAPGRDVVVLEAADQLMGRVLPPLVADWLAALHARHGVRVVTGAEVVALEDIEADVIAVGIGVVPNDDLASAAGLEVDDGVVVDEHGRTSDPAISAVGDVARHYNPLLGCHLRLESWQHAQNHAIAVARGEAYREVPWLWTDQYDCNVQVAGAPTAWDDVVVRGSVLDGAFTALTLRDGEPVGAVTVNQPREMRAARKAIAAALQRTAA